MDSISSIALSSAAGGIIIALSIYMVRAMKTTSHTYIDQIKFLSKENEEYRRRLETKQKVVYDLSVKLDKARFKMASLLENRDNERAQFREFLETKGISSSEFKFRRLEIEEYIIGEIQENNS